MQVTIKPSTIQGTIQAPTSKSSMQRACAAALLRKGETVIHNPGHSNDDLAALNVIRALGATVEKLQDGPLRITGNGINPVAGEVNCGESGLGIRMFAPLIALSEKCITINGEGSLLKRPMDFFDEIFPRLGIDVISNSGKLPLKIKGPLQPRDIDIDGSLSSQFLTGLLMAYAAAGAAGITITVNNLKSKPYIDLTLQVMKHFGWEVENRNYESFYFKKKAVNTQPLRVNYTVEGDWSGGAFLLVAGAIAGDITVKGLDVHSAQADKKIMEAFRDCGCRMLNHEGDIEISGSPSGLNAFHFDATDCPDLFPPLVALAAYCKGTTAIDGVSRLAHKESDRAITLQEEFAKMGVNIQLQGNRMLVDGGKGLKTATVHSHHDHRIAMACAVAGLKAEGKTVIEDAQAVDKSYPDFYEDLKLLHADVNSEYSIANVQ